MSIHKYYKISDEGTIVRLNPFCPRCGPGFFMAQNYDRITCGHCGYTEFKKKGSKKAKGSATAKKSAKKADAKGKRKRPSR